jgi:hypothetical protein
MLSSIGLNTGSDNKIFLVIYTDVYISGEENENCFKVSF